MSHTGSKGHHRHWIKGGIVIGGGKLIKGWNPTLDFRDTEFVYEKARIFKGIKRVKETSSSIEIKLNPTIKNTLVFFFFHSRENNWSRVLFLRSISQVQQSGDLQPCSHPRRCTSQGNQGVKSCLNKQGRHTVLSNICYQPPLNIPAVKYHNYRRTLRHSCTPRKHGLR